MAKKSLRTTAVLSIIAGILVIAWPAALAWAVGLWLLINGILDLRK